MIVYLDHKVKVHSSCFYLWVIVMDSNCRSCLCSRRIWSAVTVGLWVGVSGVRDDEREGKSVSVFSQAGVLGRRPEI